MKFTCNRDNLIEGINVVQKAVPTRTTMPILDGILIEVGEELRLTGNDLELGIVFEVPAIIEEIGSIVLASKTFGDIIRKLPDIYVTIETSNDNNTVSITSGNAQYQLRTIAAEEYPRVVTLTEENVIAIAEKDLKNLIRQSLFAASQEDTRPILKGVLIEHIGKSLNFVALDGYKLAVKTLEREKENSFRVVATSRVLNEVLKILQSSEDLIQFCCSENQIMFYTESFRIVSRLLKGDFIDYGKMLPREYKTTVSISCKELLNGIERAALVMTDERKTPLLITIDDDEIILSANADNGTSREVISAEVTGEKMEIGFNPKNVMECLRVIEEETIQLHLTTNVGPCIIKSEENDDYTYLVMPVKTKNM